MAIVGRGAIVASDARSNASPWTMVTLLRPSSSVSRRGLEVLDLVVAQDRRDGDVAEVVNRLEDVTAGPRGDVQQADRTALGVRPLDGLPEQALQVDSPLPDAAQPMLLR